MIRTLLFAASVAVAIPATAQDAMPQNLAERLEGAREAQAIGLRILEILQAKSVAQAQYSGMHGGDFGTGYRGAVALPADTAGVWRVTIVGQPGGSDAPLLALADYEVAEQRILSESIYTDDQRRALQGDTLAMARAQIVAPRAVIAAPGTTFCRDGEEVAEGSPIRFTAITIAMPPAEDGSFDAYVLNGPFDARQQPLGKHHRVSFDKFGVIGEPELLTDTCEVVTWDADSSDLAMSVYVTEYDRGEWPNEIYAFISAQLPMSMGVVTGDIIWPMAGGTIAAPVPAHEAGY